jgi:DNA-binding NarL/FixJ family response regulator
MDPARHHKDLSKIVHLADASNSARDHPSPPARLLVADDYYLIREAMRGMLAGEAGLKMVGEAENGRLALELCRQLHPDLVLMDVRMPEMDGIEATRAIKAECPGVIVLMITAFEDPDHLLEAIRAGAAGYVLKDSPKQQLLQAVRGVLDGESPLNQDLAMRLLKRLAGEAWQQTEPANKRPLKPPSRSLTPRELEVLGLLVAGGSNREIAEELHVSLSTVKRHLEHITSKPEVSDRTQAAVKALSFGLISERRGRG